MAGRSIRVGICSTYPPRRCGLATFTADLEVSLNEAPDVDQVHIVRVENDNGTNDIDLTTQDIAASRASVIATIVDEDVDTYVAAALIANAKCDVLILQHEFGIFGGRDGAHVMHFVDALRIPLIVTLHTVLPDFTADQAGVLRTLCTRAKFLTVFTQAAEALLLQKNMVPPEKIRLVPHGAPDVLYGGDRESARNSLRVSDQYVLSSFGLVSPGKGFELVIAALPQILKSVPNTVFVVAGRTHPGVDKHEGEAYRRRLVELISDLGVESHVRWMNEFLPIHKIADLLRSTDVFVMPYVNPDQIVSGVLTFALAAGCPVVSTDFQYARDQLVGGAGTIVASRDPAEFANAVLKYALDPDAADQARTKSRAVGAGMHWSSVGRQTALLCHESLAIDLHPVPGQPLLRMAPVSEAEKDRAHINALRSISSFALRSGSPGNANEEPFQQASQSHHAPHSSHAPHASQVSHTSHTSNMSRSSSEAALSFETKHLDRLVDDTGIIQHATGIIPLLESGYCVDDVARLIPVANLLSKSIPSWDGVVARSIAFIGHAFSKDPVAPLIRLNNFLSWDRRWLDTPYFGDHVGRAALGLASVARDPLYSGTVNPLLTQIFRQWPEDAPLHCIAYGLLAQSLAPDIAVASQRARMIAGFNESFARNSHIGWEWFETRLRYDFARFPQAVIAAGFAAHDDDAIDLGLRALRWLDRICDAGDFFRFPGCRGFASGARIDLSGGEQPLEALALVQAHLCAFEVTGDYWHRDRADRAHEWFLGRNRLSVPLVAPDGGCSDGLESDGISRNQGAESTLAYLASVQSLAGVKQDGLTELFVVV
jgi:glycosyltransferase involved in cell wall biosynthesis